MGSVYLCEGETCCVLKDVRAINQQMSRAEKRFLGGGGDWHVHGALGATKANLMSDSDLAADEVLVQ